MFRNKSVLTQTFLAVSIPLVAVFFLVLSLSLDVLRKGAESFARETVRNFAEQVSIRIEDRLAVMYTSLNMTRRGIEAIDYSSPTAQAQAERALRDMLLSSEGVYSAWLAFEPGVVRQEERFIKSFVKTGRYIRDINSITPAMLDDSARSPWYDLPLRSGSNYFVTADRHDYGIGEGPVYRGTLTFPVKKGGVVVGCVGVDVLYRQLLNFMQDLQIMDAQRTMAMVTSELDVIYTTAPPGTPVLAEPADVEPAAFSKGPTMRYASLPGRKEQVFICLAPINTARSSVQTFLYIELPPDALVAGMVPLVRNISLISALCFLLLGAGIYFTIRGIVRPVKELTRKADTIAGGDLDVDFGGDDDVDAVSPNELKRLRLALKQMVRQLGDVHAFRLAAARAEMEREKIQEANAAKSQFFATMSHEIRTPMNAIIGLSELLLARPLQPEDRAHVQDVKLSAVSLLRLINDILDTSKMEAGRFELKEDDYNFQAMLDNVNSVVALMAKQKGLDYTFDVGDDLPVFLHGDGERLRQILLNLLSNAVKYTPTGHMDFSVSRNGDRLRFAVADTGMGIREEDLSLIFDPYRQADAKKTGGIQGTGLGLNITRQLVEMMGGIINVKSAVGKGSVFEVELPFLQGDASRATPAAETVAPAPALTRRNARALVVDDNVVNCKVAQGLLGLYGVEADTVLSGREAIGKVAVNEYDLVFMDHMMPGMDGVETTRVMREHGGRGSTIPIIALTANAMPQTRDFLLKQGMNDFLSKPIDKEKLRELLGKWLDGDKNVE